MPLLDSDFIDSIVNPQYQPWFSLDGLRRYAAAREGMSPPFRGRASASFGDRYAGSPVAPSSDVSAPMISGSASAPYSPTSEGMPGLPVDAAKTDPFAAYDAGQTAAMPPGAPLRFGGMYNKFGLLNAPSNQLTPGSAAPAMAAPIDVAAPPVQEAPLGNVALSARSAMPPAAAAPAAPEAAGPGSKFLSRISDVLNNNPSTLLALGAGFAGAPNIGAGMSRAFSAAVPAVKQDQALTLQRQGIQGTYSALVAAGATPAEALAAAYNPDVLKAMTQRLFGQTAHWGVTGHDEYGNPKYGFINDALQTVVEGSKVTVPRVKSPEEVLRLPKGQHFIGWDGHEYVR